MINVVWSERALNEIQYILEYWLNRNKSYSYPSKILKEVDQAVILIITNPNVGLETNHREVNMRLMLNRFYLVYRINQDEMEILKFWDCRQNPKSNLYFK